jgi:hypothetical protein
VITDDEKADFISPKNPKRPKYSVTPVTPTKIEDIQHIFKDLKEAERFVDEYQAINNSNFSVYRTSVYSVYKTRQEGGFNTKGNKDIYAILLTLFNLVPRAYSFTEIAFLYFQE